MAKIKVNDIKPTGSELFEDTESFLSEVSSDELEDTIGGTMIAYQPIYNPTIQPKPTPPEICYPIQFTAKIYPLCPYTPVIL